jgi:hypothetical protein
MNGETPERGSRRWGTGATARTEGHLQRGMKGRERTKVSTIPKKIIKIGKIVEKLSQECSKWGNW